MVFWLLFYLQLPSNPALKMFSSPPFPICPPPLFHSLFCLFRCAHWGTVEIRQINVWHHFLYISFIYISVKFRDSVQCNAAQRSEGIFRGRISEGVVSAIESTSCATKHCNNSSGQLREQQCGFLIIWTCYYHSLVIGSQALHQPRKVSAHRWVRWLFVCNSTQRSKQRWLFYRGSFAFYCFFVLLCRRCWRFWRLMG